MVSATSDERLPFPVALKSHPRQGISRSLLPGPEVVQGHVDDDAAIGIAFVAAVLAHAVGHHPIRF